MPDPKRAQKAHHANQPLAPLNIAFITDRFGHQFGGAEAYGVELMRELAKRHHITVIGYEYDPACSLQLPFIRVKEPALRQSWLRSYLFARRVNQLLATRNFQIVHSHVNGWSANVDVLHVRSVNYRWQFQKSRFNKLLDLFNPRIQMYRWLEKKRIHLTGPKRTVAVSDNIKKQIQAAYHTQHDFAVIPPGVHRRQVEPATRNKIRQQLGLTAQDSLAIFVARNPERKGLSVILQVLPRLQPTAKLLVVGPDSAMVSGLKAELLKSGLEQRVHFIAQVADMHPYYQAADLCLHPTLNDSFGMAPLEAMSYALPVIMSDAPYCGFAQYVTAGQNALLLSDPTDSEELLRCWQKLLQDGNLHQRLCQGAAELARQFDWDRISRQYEQIYAEVLGV